MFCRGGSLSLTAADEDGGGGGGGKYFVEQALSLSLTVAVKVGGGGGRKYFVEGASLSHSQWRRRVVVVVESIL